VSYVTFSTTVEATVESFDADEFRAALSGYLGVAPAGITITVRPASVSVLSTVTALSSTEAHTLAKAVEALGEDVDSAAETLGVTVKQIGDVQITDPQRVETSSLPASLEASSPGDSTTGAVIGSIVGAVVLCHVLVGVNACRRQAADQKHFLEGNQPVSDEGAKRPPPGRRAPQNRDGMRMVTIEQGLSRQV
jgi:hypothetical protein